MEYINTKGSKKEVFLNYRLNRFTSCMSFVYVVHDLVYVVHDKFHEWLKSFLLH